MCPNITPRAHLLADVVGQFTKDLIVPHVQVNRIVLLIAHFGYVLTMRFENRKGEFIKLLVVLKVPFAIGILTVLCQVR